MAAGPSEHPHYGLDSLTDETGNPPKGSTSATDDTEMCSAQIHHFLAI